MANHNGGRFIDDALESCLRQTIKNIEVLVIDDASTDDSIKRIKKFIERDDRIHLFQMAKQTGPAGARNRGLEAARGAWIAILDSDDIMHPQRLSKLVAAAETANIEIIADNQLVFESDNKFPAYSLIRSTSKNSHELISIIDYIRSNDLFTKGMPLGYLKPVILKSFIDAKKYRYNSSLRIAEDYDLIARLLLGGAAFHMVPQMMYFYRRHPQSISHRLSKTTLLSMLASSDISCPGSDLAPTQASIAIKQALAMRHRSIQKAIDFESLIQFIKSHQWFNLIKLCCDRPNLIALLLTPLKDRIRRTVMAKRSSPSRSRRRISLLSRQRIVGTTNGSSAYLLGVCRALHDAGYEVELISPSPAMFGRWPFLRLDHTMELFSSIRIRGSFRLGRIVIAKDPRIAGRAALGMIHRLLARSGIVRRDLDRKAPHAIAVPLTNADRIFIANSSHRSTAILADYAFLNEALPFMLQPRVPTAVIMHDLFFTQDPRQTVVLLDRKAEMELLDLADTVIAIQAEEKQLVEQDLPRKPVVLVPMAISPSIDVQPGQDGSILFVGSNSHPNIDGISWFLKDIWPSIINTHPKAWLRIAGTCCGSLTDIPANVTLLGRIDDLDEAYAQAGVVVSPLRLGSGLKIKLIEAIGHGKAAVVTATTLQGVQDIVAHAVVEATIADDFIEAVNQLLYDPEKRAQIGSRALAVAATHFSPSACYRDLLTLVRDAECAQPH